MLGMNETGESLGKEKSRLCSCHSAFLLGLPESWIAIPDICEKA